MFNVYFSTNFVSPNKYFSGYSERKSLRILKKKQTFKNCAPRKRGFDLKISGFM